MAAANRSRIVIDCQLLQSSDRHRGMGLYLYSLLTALASLNPNQEWTFLINKNLPALTTEDEQLLKRLKGQVLEIDLLAKKDKPTLGAAAEANRSAVDKALKHLIKNNGPEPVFFIPALFSNDIYPVFPGQGTANMTLFHDIIPFLYHKQYLANPAALRDYAERFSEFYKTDLFVTNSQTTADDLVVYFGVDPERAVAILGAGASRAGVQPRAPKIGGQLKEDFILMPSGDDFRKNNALAAQALADLSKDIPLVITSNFSEGSRRTLKEIYPSTIFTGSVTDEEYLWLVDNARAVLFPTEYEGLGMPVLEAVDRGAMIACSNIPVFAEISPEAFFYFDPKSVSDASAVIDQALNAGAAQAQAKKRHYAGIQQRFSWNNTAKAFLAASKKTTPPKSTKKKLAVFSPSPDSYSAIGKYVFELHAELSRLFEITYFIEEGFTAFSPARPDILKYAADYRPAADFSESTATEFDHILYNVGNSEFHTDTILNALRLPGNAIIHDTKLNGIFDYMMNRKIITSARRDYEALLDKAFKTQKTSCVVSVATNQKAVFCHSDYAIDGIQAIVGGKLPVSKLNLPTGVPAIELHRLAAPVISFAGIISEDKGINLVAQVGRLDNVQVKVFGFGVLGDSPLLQNLGDNVEVLKDLSDKDFQDALRRSTILINYRLKYNGETSLSTLEAMRYGTVVIVHDTGWYGELPDNTVVKVKDETEVFEAVQKLAADPEACRKIGAAARDYVRKNHGHAGYAQTIKERIK